MRMVLIPLPLWATLHGSPLLSDTLTHTQTERRLVTQEALGPGVIVKPQVHPEDAWRYVNPKYFFYGDHEAWTPYGNYLPEVSK